MRVHAPDHKSYVDFPDGTTPEEMKAVMRKHFPASTRPEHDDLVAAAVTGQDSFDLQNLAPELKPAVKMTFDQFAPIFARGIPGKVAVVMEDGTTYIIDYAATDPVEAMEQIMEGDDSELLGYPENGEEDAAVTKQGEVVTDLGEMRKHAAAGNIAWAANGSGKDLMNKAGAVSNAIRGR